MSAIEQLDQINIEEFIRRYQQQPFELIEGELKPIMPPVAMHGLMVRALFVLLYQHCVAHELGEVITEMPNAIFRKRKTGRVNRL